MEYYTEELKNNVTDDLNVKKVYISNAYSLDDLFEDDCLVLIWEREEIESMTATQMAALIEELTGKKVRIEPSMGEMYGALELYCNSMPCSECIFNGDCFNICSTIEELKPLYEKIMEEKNDRENVSAASISSK